MSMDTKCWKCSGAYSVRSEKCPSCGANNANLNWEVAQLQRINGKLRDDIETLRAKLAEAKQYCTMAGDDLRAMRKVLRSREDALIGANIENESLRKELAAPDLSVDECGHKWGGSVKKQCVYCGNIYELADIKCKGEQPDIRTQPDAQVTVKISGVTVDNARRLILAFVPPLSEWPEGAEYWAFDSTRFSHYYNSPPLKLISGWNISQGGWCQCTNIILPNDLRPHWAESLWSKGDVMAARGES